MINTMHPDWQTAIADFLAGRRSPQTRRSYALAIERFGAYLADHHITYAEATPRHVAAWMQSLHGLCSVNSIRARLSALSAFYDHVAQHTHPSLRSDNPTRAVAWPQRQLPRRKARDRALDAAKATELIDIADTRARALIALMAIEGLRCAECLALRWNDYDGAILLVTGKGGKRRFVQLAEQTTAILETWARESRAQRAPGPGADAPLFPGRGPNGAIAPQHAARIVRTLGAAIGVDLSPHPLRATAISEWLAAGVALVEAQRAAGHASPSTTEGYAVVKTPAASSKSRIGRKSSREV